MANSVPCGCGRSPTGSCIGWHNLTNEAYLQKKAEYEKQNLSEQKQFLTEINDKHE